MRHTVQLFLDEIALLKGPLDEEKRKQLRNLAESTINMMCSLDRKPNGLRFSGARKASLTNPNIGTCRTPALVLGVCTLK